MRIFQSQWKRTIDRVAVGAGWVAGGNSERGGLDVWAVASRDVVRSRQPSTRWGRKSIHSLAIDAVGRLYLSVGDDDLQVIDLATGSESVAPQPELGFAQVALSANASRVLTASSMNQAGAVSAWEAQAGGSFRKLWNDGPHEFKWFREPAISADGRLAATLERWPSPARIKQRTFRVAVRDTARKKVISVSTFGVIDPPFRLAVTNDGRLLAGWVKAVRVWDITAGEPVGEIANPALHTFTGLAVHPSGQTFLTADTGGLVRLWDTVTLRETSALNWQLGPLRSLAIAPDGTTAAAGTEDGRVVVWDVDL